MEDGAIDYKRMIFSIFAADMEIGVLAKILKIGYELFVYLAPEPFPVEEIGLEANYNCLKTLIYEAP